MGQEDLEFKASLGYIVRSTLKKKKESQNKVIMLFYIIMLFCNIYTIDFGICAGL